MENVTVITGVTVVHPEREGAAVLEPDSTVIIHGNRIDAVLQHARDRADRRAPRSSTAAASG